MLKLGGQEWEIIREDECSYCRSMTELHDRFYARLWLERFRGNSLSMAALRRILSREGRLQLDRASEDEVIKQAAELLACGVWHAHELLDIHGPASKAVQSSTHTRQSSSLQTGGPGPSIPAPKNVPLTLPALKVADSDSPTFSSRVDAAALANVLARSADQGVPFCNI
jgi:hypothetical protein